MAPAESLSNEWQTVDAIPPLLDDELQLWRIELPVKPGFLETCRSLLTEEETTRANRRKQAEARLQFIVGRGTLRILLAAACGLEPGAIPLATSPGGKPELPGVDLAFNVAHSGPTILIALHRGGLVGVDVETVKPSMQFADVAKHSFTESENQELSSISDLDQRRYAFYQQWARKEAIAKADGRGLRLSTSSFELPLSRSQSATVEVSRLSGSGNKRFYVNDLPLGSEIAGAIAMDSAIVNMKLLMFPMHEIQKTSPLPYKMELR